jgi:hypothetical protein
VNAGRMLEVAFADTFERRRTSPIGRTADMIVR